MPCAIPLDELTGDKFFGITRLVQHAWSAFARRRRSVRIWCTRRFRTSRETPRRVAMSLYCQPSTIRHSNRIRSSGVKSRRRARNRSGLIMRRFSPGGARTVPPSTTAAPYRRPIFVGNQKGPCTERGSKTIRAGCARGFWFGRFPRNHISLSSEEASGHQNRVPLKVLLEMQEHGWIRRVPQGPQRCDYWEITDQGREAIPGSAGNLHNHQ